VMLATTMHQGISVQTSLPSGRNPRSLQPQRYDVYIAAVENNCEGICASGIKVWRKIGESAPGFDASWTLCTTIPLGG